jgi:hypothetical protein
MTDEERRNAMFMKVAEEISLLIEGGNVRGLLVVVALGDEPQFITNTSGCNSMFQMEQFLRAGGSLNPGTSEALH